MLRPEDFGPTGTSDDTAAVQAAIDAGVLYQEKVCIERMHFVSTIVVSGANRFVIDGDGVLKGVGALPGSSAVLEVINSVCVKIDGLNCDASQISSYGPAFKFWSNLSAGAFNCCVFSINCQNSRIGMQFGDSAHPDLAISENVVHHGHFYNVAQGFYIVGSQAVLNIDHFQNITDNTNFSGVEQVSIILEGSTVHVVGGETVGPANQDHAVIVNKAFSSPIYGERYGRAYLSEQAIETPGRLMRTDANGCIAPSHGALIVEGHGFVGSDAHHFVELDGLWNGIVDTSRSRFRSDTARTKSNVFANPKPGGGINDKAIIRTDDSFVGMTPKGPFGVHGGVYGHGLELVLDARNTGLQVVPSGAWANLHYGSNDVPPRYASCFDGVTYTVPAGGHKTAIVTMSAPTNVPVAEIEITLNGMAIDATRIAYAGQLSVVLSNLQAGQTIVSRINGISGSGVVAGGVKDRFQILAAS